MQLFGSILIIFTIIIIVPTTVSADQMVRYIFNNGIEPVIPACNSTETAMIDALFVNRRRRHNRRQLTTTTISNTTISRGLITYPSRCKQNCLGIKCCYATGCQGYDGTIIKNRKLSVCDNVIASINQKLDALPVSTMCKSYWSSSKRTSECYDDVRYGEVFGAKLWTISGSSTQTSVDLPLTGYSFCKSKSFNIEALLNECVDVAGFRLNGPNGYTTGRFENSIPYSLFGDSDGKFFGLKLNITGAYSLTIKPDNYIEKQKVFKFTVNNC